MGHTPFDGAHGERKSSFEIDSPTAQAEPVEASGQVFERAAGVSELRFLCFLLLISFSSRRGFRRLDV